MFTRRLGRSNLEVSAMGLGCWPIGGPWTYDGEPTGWGKVDDAESIRAIHYALDTGINFFDTAANYGCGHSGRILGKAVAGRRDIEPSPFLASRQSRKCRRISGPWS
jgi:aryl-alcohol dehydrogenase-like predicted oxidoreductase